MKLAAILLLLMLADFPVFAQTGRGENVNSDAKTSSVNQLIDSIQTSFYQQSDSLIISFKTRLQRLDSVQSDLKIKLDTIIRHKHPNGFVSGIDSIQSTLIRRLDSLTLLDPAGLKISHALDSVKQQFDNAISELDNKMQSIKDSIVAKLNGLDLSSNLTNKISSVSEKINDFKIPAADLNIPPMNGSGGLQKLNNIQTAASIGDLKNGNLNIGGLTKVSADHLGYGDTFQQLTDGKAKQLKDLPQLAETKAAEFSKLNEAKEQTKVLDEYKELSGKMQNPDSLKEFVVQEVKDIAVDHFGGKEQQLTEAMETLARYKSKYPNLNSISEVTKRPPNEMKGKPLVEKLIPGIGIQIQKKGEDLMVDFNPYTGYRFTTRIAAGLGWNQRVVYNLDHNQFNPPAKIYGPRIFGEYKLWRGFSPRAELEIMNTSAPPLASMGTVDPLKREWVWGAFVGLKKEYRFFKNIQGTALVMTRLFNPDHKSPYVDVLNVRFGFEFPMKKKVKASN